jgi:hypothetical protein
MEFQKFDNEDMVVLVAPDGHPQPMTLAEDFPTCVAVIEMHAKMKMGKPFAKLLHEGFRILPVKLSMTQSGDENKAFDDAKAKIDNPEKERQSTITREQLLENGWKIVKGEGLFLMEKDLTDYSHYEEDEEPEGQCTLVLHGMNGDLLFALAITDGYLININPGSIEELNAFEKIILSVEPPY